LDIKDNKKNQFSKYLKKTRFPFGLKGEDNNLYKAQKCVELFAFFNLVIFSLDIDSYAIPYKLFLSHAILKQIRI
jgi:hypothetical protein